MVCAKFKKIYKEMIPKLRKISVKVETLQNFLAMLPVSQSRAGVRDWSNKGQIGHKSSTEHLMVEKSLSYTSGCLLF